MSDIRIVSAGDAAMVVEFAARIDPEVNARAIALAEAIRAVMRDRVRDVVTTYRSVAIYFDPLRIDVGQLERELSLQAERIRHRPESHGARIEVPVHYGGEDGPDLGEVARFADCTEDEAIRLHAGETYRVYMLGFVPGFTYMGRVNPRIAAPRRATPRVRVPAGSIGIASFQTGIYPAETPGGWQLIGRTSVKPFDPGRSEPFLFKPGDLVRFVPI